MRKLWKLHIGIIVGFIISFMATLFIVYSSDKSVSVYLPPALLLTYEYLIINLLKGDFLTKEFEEKARRELDDNHYLSIMIYRGIIRFALWVCVILAPIMWSLVIIK